MSCGSQMPRRALNTFCQLSSGLVRFPDSGLATLWGLEEKSRDGAGEGRAVAAAMPSCANCGSSLVAVPDLTVT